MALLSQTAEYALQAATLLAQQDGAVVEVGLLADTLGVPRNYLSKTLSQLVRAGVLESVRGKRGGFRLARSARDITLLQVVEPFDRLTETGRCLLGQLVCSDRLPCAAHHQWKELKERFIRFFRRTTLAEMARGQTRWPNTGALTGIGR
ncbi:MAG: Rrf2 family transcriptional regulator [Gemmatimonadales bacterium]